MIDWLLEQEERMGLETPTPYPRFRGAGVPPPGGPDASVCRSLVADGKKVLGYGASTKGNVLLQFCGVTTASDIPAIAEVNPEK